MVNMAYTRERSATTMKKREGLFIGSPELIFRFYRKKLVDLQLQLLEDRQIRLFELRRGICRNFR